MTTLSFPTETQAADYFRTHGEDVGRPYVVTGFQSPVKARDAAFEGFARWECGFAGRWPERTAMRRDTMERPPVWLEIRPETVTFKVGGRTVVYRVCDVEQGAGLKLLRDLYPPEKFVLLERRP